MLVTAQVLAHRLGVLAQMPPLLLLGFLAFAAAGERLLIRRARPVQHVEQPQPFVAVEVGQARLIEQPAGCVCERARRGDERRTRA